MVTAAEQGKLEFLCGDENTCTFLRRDAFEQVEFPLRNPRLAQELLQPGTEISGEFFDGEPISIVLPDTIGGRVVTTAPPSRPQQDSIRKEAKLENGLTIRVPLFVAPGETVCIDRRTGRYVERVRAQHKRGV